MPTQGEYRKDEHERTASGNGGRSQLLSERLAAAGARVVAAGDEAQPTLIATVEQMEARQRLRCNQFVAAARAFMSEWQRDLEAFERFVGIK